MKVISVVGARPNFMKVGPVHRALLKSGHFESLIVHTGQHYDERMSDIFFQQLELPEPDVYLGIGGGSHAQQTARILTAFEKVVLDEQPDLVLVVGDVNSTLACSLVASKLNIPVAHVEAGLRSKDRRMPEEINRIITDSISDFLFVTEQSGLDNLEAEGIPAKKVFFVGNVMIDSLVRFREKAAHSTILDDLSLESNQYALLTMHRPSNVDHEEGVCALLTTIQRVAEHYPIVFPIHPRTKGRFSAFGLLEELERVPRVNLLEPLGYFEFLKLMEHAGVVITDSGGIQEETTYLQVPCLTLRENTERPVTVTMGTNVLLSLKPDIILEQVLQVRHGNITGEVPPLWDGQAAERIVTVLAEQLNVKPSG